MKSKKKQAHRHKELINGCHRQRVGVGEIVKGIKRENDVIYYNNNKLNNIKVIFLKC